MRAWQGLGVGLMHNPDLEGGEWSAVQVGPETLGWVGPYLPAHRFNLHKADITVLMGDDTFEMDVVSLMLAQRHGIELSSQASVIDMSGHSRFFAVRVPAASLDISSGEIVYSEQSVQVLYTALAKFFSAYVAMVQSELHELVTPVEVVRKFTELVFHKYPSFQREKLTWRGQNLNLVSKGTKAQVSVVQRKKVNRNPYTGHWGFRELPGKRPFASLVSWQTRSYFGPRKTPENVIHVRASSMQEFELGKHYFGIQGLLDKYLMETQPTLSEATFFLTVEGDVLEEWIDGDTVSMEEFTVIAARLDDQIYEDAVKSKE